MRTEWGMAVRLVATLCLLGALVLPRMAEAQAPPAAGKPVTIAMVLPRDEQNIEAALRTHLAREGLNVHYEALRWSGREEDQPALVQQLRTLAPDLIYTWGTPTTLAVGGRYDGDAAAAIHDRPIVFTEVTDPVGSRLVQRLDVPGRPLTGVRHLAPLEAQLAAMRSYRPFRRIGVIVNPAEPNTALVRDALRPLVKQQQLEIVDATIPLGADGAPDPQALPGLIRNLAARGAEVLYLGPSTFLALTHRDVVTQSARDARLPTFCATESVVRESNCLFGLFSNGANTGRFAAVKILQILRDRKPAGQIPIETLQRFSLLVNMPVAKVLGLYPPLALLDVAEVIPVASERRR